MSLADRIRTRALELGFDVVGIAPARPPPHADALRPWLEQGYEGGMSWMARAPERRADPCEVLPRARAVVTVGVSCFAAEPPPETWNDPLRGRIARYAWGRDYHNVLLPMLEDLASFVVRELHDAVLFKAYVDTGPVLERAVAEAAGIGFTGRNTMLISRTFGSYLFLGELLLDGELEPDPPVEHAAPKAGHPCGACRRCLAACPTGAFPEPYVLDARRCISYLTIEHKGPIPAELRPLMRNWIFGCDECQQVCPWVRRFSKPGKLRFLAFDPERCAPKLADLMALDERAFQERFAGTPILRLGRTRLLRNAAVALGNAGDPSAKEVLEPAAADPDPLIREHAAWALGQLR